ncbi:hypothetical protein [Rhodococcus qingshengii]|uniref:hypothetical protein n=1 Tax=Rhodococcus qingshengii TaxID=334542 RepID=UPI0035D75E64
MTWAPIGCARRDEVYASIENRFPLAGRSDIVGEFGGPRIETIWGDKETEREILKDVRHPRYEWDSQSGDREPCEHYEWTAS